MGGVITARACDHSPCPIRPLIGRSSSYDIRKRATLTRILGVCVAQHPIVYTVNFGLCKLSLLAGVNPRL